MYKYWFLLLIFLFLVKHLNWLSFRIVIHDFLRVLIYLRADFHDFFRLLLVKTDCRQLGFDFIIDCFPDPVIMEKLLKESPFSLVKFQVYAKREEMKFNDRRLNRVRNKNRIPFGPWARSVTESVYILR